MTEQTRKQTNLSNYYIKKSDIKDNLTSTDTDKPLSANQGKELKELINNIDVQEAIDLTDYIQKSNTNGLIKNNGSIDTNTYLTEHQSLDNYIQKSNTNGLVKNNGTIDTNTYVKTSDIEDNLTSTNTNKPLSAKQGRELKALIDNLDLNSGSGETVDLTNYIQKSSTEGLLKNDGTVDTNTYLTQHQSLDNYIQKSNTTGLIKNDGSVDTNTYLTQHQSLDNYIQKSNTNGLVKNDGTIDTNDYATEEELFSKDYEDLFNTPEIPTKVSDLTNDSGFLTEHQSLDNYIEKSNTTGLVKNDGTIDTNTYLTEHQSLNDYIQKSNTTGLVKNDGTIDTNTYLTQHQSLDSKNVTVEKQITAEEGYLSTYSIKQGNTQVGQINIPRDYLVKSASIETCSVDDTPAGFEEGDKYIDFVINVKEGSANNEHIYLAVNDLVDAYTAGTGLVLTNNNEFKHSNSITAQNTNEFKKFKFDSEGHITGTADVEGSDLPNHVHTVFITEFIFEDILNFSNGDADGNQFLATAEDNDVEIEPNTLYLVRTTDHNGAYSNYISYITYEKNNTVKAELLNDWTANWNRIAEKPSTYPPASHQHSYNDLTNKPTLSNVATSGSYNDLSNKPTLSSLSTGQEELLISDITDLSEIIVLNTLSSYHFMELTGGVSGKPCYAQFFRVGKIVFFKIYGTFHGGTFAGTVYPYAKTVNPGNNIPKEFRPIKYPEPRPTPNNGTDLQDDVVIHMDNYGTNSVSGMAVRITPNGTITLVCRDNTKDMLYFCSGTYLTDYSPFNTSTETEE